MDVNATLAEIRNIMVDLNNPRMADLKDSLTNALVDNLFALDQWLSAGGFLPEDWDR